MKKFLYVLMAMVLIFSFATAPAFAEGVPPAAGTVDIVVNYGVVIFAALCALVVLIFAIIAFIKKPRAEQIAKLKEWLLWAVVKAEKEFGRETGVIKLRYVYDLFIVTFPALAKLISFETFSKLVDDALEKMETLLTTNPKIKNLVESDGVTDPAPYTSAR